MGDHFDVDVAIGEGGEHATGDANLERNVNRHIQQKISHVSSSMDLANTFRGHPIKTHHVLEATDEGQDNHVAQHSDLEEATWQSSSDQRVC